MTTPHNILSSILYTLNSQILGKNDPTVAECFLGPSGKVQCHGPLERFYVRSMEEPDPGIHRSQDCVCDFPQGAEKPLWTPERLTQPVERGRRASKVSPEATPEEKEENGITESSSTHEEQSLPTNHDSDEAT